jgi:glycerol-3-phosphate acyltransferase PlsY
VEIGVCLITIAAAYLLGTIPAGYLAGKWQGIDIRAAGSGNIGATNAFRILGKPAGTVVLVVDGLKGWLAAAILPELVWRWLSPASGPAPEYLRILAGVVAVLGHNYNCWLKFKGGKGIATSAGVLAALVPWTFVVALAVWIILCVATKYVSVASIAAALVLPFATWAFHYSATMITITALMGALAIYKHKGNISRLLNGTENKVGRKKVPAPSEVVS